MSFVYQVMLGRLCVGLGLSLCASLSAVAQGQAKPATAPAPALQPAEVTNERLAILSGERDQITAALAKATADQSPEGLARRARLADDMRAIDAEIARVAKQPAYALRNTNGQTSSPPPKPEARKQPAAVTAVASSSTHLFGSGEASQEPSTDSPFVFSAQPRHR